MSKTRGLLWWIDRWRQSTAYMDMTLEEQGAYRNLLDEAWLRGGAIPDNDAILAKASGDAMRWPALRGIVLRRFYLGLDGWRNETLDEIRRFCDLQAQRRARYEAKRTGKATGVRTEWRTK